MLPIANFPQRIYQTQHPFNDFSTDDMKYGDLTETQLRHQFGLDIISNTVDPWNLRRFTPFSSPQSRFAGSRINEQGDAISVGSCAKRLFDEMRITSLPYSFLGSCKPLIKRLLTHLETSDGASFSDVALNNAYRDRIINDNSVNSSCQTIKKIIDTNIDYRQQGYPLALLPEFEASIAQLRLPKFDSMVLDKVNGLGISVHDVHASRIEITRLVVSEKRWWATVRYYGQDHFGLGKEDILKKKFSQFHFFRIWFVLQRYNRFGFRPFLTNMNASIDLSGGR